METAPLDDPRTGGWDPDDGTANKLAIVSTLDEIQVAPRQPGSYPPGTCSWCGNEKTLIGMGSLTYVSGRGFVPRVMMRRACKLHISNLKEWKVEADQEYEQRVLGDQWRLVLAWMLVTLHGWQRDDDGVVWRGAKQPPPVSGGHS
jgi:hypothetical protein